jgi:hypothetical protein
VNPTQTTLPAMLRASTATFQVTGMNDRIFLDGATVGYGKIEVKTNFSSRVNRPPK